MDGVLNETTGTVHRSQVGGPDLQTECGISYHVAPEQLRATTVERATAEFGANRCGRCFEGAGGY